MSPPKTRKSRRQVTLSPSLSLLLCNYKQQVEGQCLLLDKPLIEADFLFAHPNGTPLDLSTVTHVFRKVIHNAGLESVRLHDLRHSYTSLMLAAGVNAKAIRSWLNRLGVKTLYIEAGSPWENVYIESFNGKLRDELLNRESFTTLD